MNRKLEMFSLGGLKEFGKNCYCFKKGEEIIIVDCGIKFLSNNNLANGAIPDFTYLKENIGKLKALFITHAHEDHIGAVPYLLKEIPNLPVYGSEFTTALLKQKLEKDSNHSINIFNDDTVIRTGEFKVSFFRVTHSIPGSFGLIIETINDEKLRMVLTGDFKFDWTEIGEKTDLIKLANCSKEGVDILFCESTNAGVPGTTPSEKKVIKRLKEIIVRAKGAVIITSFASNVYRLKEVIRIAEENDKKIVLLGSSLLKMIKAIQISSLWKLDNKIFLKPSAIPKFKRNRLIIFCTGSQGEAKAVLNRLANQDYPGLKVEEGDTIIETSSPIKDNKVNIEAINNRLFELKAEIYENDGAEGEILHASGHACQEDLKLMIRLVNPRYLIPIHGDLTMLNSLANLAEQMDDFPSENILVCGNGEIVENEGKDFKITDRIIPEKYNYVMNKKLINSEVLHNDLETRDLMSAGGVILLIIFYIGENPNNWDLPHIFTYGFINMEKNKKLINLWKYKIQSFLMQNLITSNINEKNVYEKLISNYFSSELLKNWRGNKPFVSCLIEKK